MTNPNIIDFQMWEEEFQQPFGSDMLVEVTVESPERVLACTDGRTDGLIMGIAPEDIDALSLA